MINREINAVRMKLADGGTITQQDLSNLAAAIRLNSSATNRALYAEAKRNTAETKVAAATKEIGDQTVQTEPTAAQLQEEVTEAFNKAQSTQHQKDKLRYVKAKRRYNVLKEYEADQQALAASKEDAATERGGE